MVATFKNAKAQWSKESLFSCLLQRLGLRLELQPGYTETLKGQFVTRLVERERGGERERGTSMVAWTKRNPACKC
jgi:hypothetical protein